MVEVANGRSLVWGAEAVQALRERLGVGGRTVGALPRGPRQNSRLGLPLLLMPEEARLLAEIGAVTLVSAPRPDPRQHSLVRGWAAVRTPWTWRGGIMWEWATGISGFGALRLGGLRESGFLASEGKAYLDRRFQLSLLPRLRHPSSDSKSRASRSKAPWRPRPVRPGVRGS